MRAEDSRESGKEIGRVRMKVVIGSDHAGFDAKRRVGEALRAAGHTVLDVGTANSDSTDYPDYAEKVARAVASGAAERGILICGTGIGMSIAANKVDGVRAALCTDEFTTRMSRQHNDANVFCAGARVLPIETIERLVQLFLETPFEGGRHQGRLDKIKSIETA